MIKKVGSSTFTQESTSFAFSHDATVPDEAYGAGWNGSLEVPTKNAVYDKIEGLGNFQVSVQRVGSVAWSDAGTFYFGNSENNTDTAGQTYRVYLTKDCTLKRAVIYSKCPTTVGSNEQSTVYIRKNDTTDTALTTTWKMDLNDNVQTISGLSVSFSAGDYFLVKWVTPTWATNPTSSTFSVFLYFE